MKKFSKITNSTVNEEPKVDIKVDEATSLKLKILDVLDRYLKVQAYGPVDNRYLAGKVVIAGKEMVAEALLDFLKEDSNKKEEKVLESLKDKIQDWEALDSAIEALRAKRPSLNNKMNISKLLEKGYDEESLVAFVESGVSNLNDSDTLKDYYKLISDSKLSEDTKLKILNIYQSRIDEIK